MRFHKLFVCLLIATSFLMITACGGGGGGGSNPSGEVTMSITDAKPLLPEGANQATNLTITFTDILVHKSGGGWISLPLTGDLPTTTIDLMQFYGENTTEIVPPVLLEYGRYTQIRIIVSEARISFDNGDNWDSVVIPSENLKTDKNFIFDVDQPTAADIVIDFDLSKSLVVTDDGSGALSYKCKPVLHIVDTLEAATITGLIDNSSFVDTYNATVTIFLYNPDLIVPDYEEYTKVEVSKSTEEDPTEFSIFWLVPNEGLNPSQDYKVAIDFNSDGSPDFEQPNIYLEDGEFIYLNNDGDPICVLDCSN